MNFNSKETYLAAIVEWRVRYQAQLKLVRQAKLNIKAAQRALESVYPPMRDHRDSVKLVFELQIERASGRTEAQRQYMETKLALA